MRIFGNIIWHLFCFGWLTSLISVLFGALFSITGFLTPIGLGLIQYAKFTLAPFSYSMISKKELRPVTHKSGILWKLLSVIGFILYAPFGIALVIFGVFQAIVLICTIIGIPMAIPYIKSLGTLFNPIGKVCVPRVVATAVKARNDAMVVEKYIGNM